MVENLVYKGKKYPIRVSYYALSMTQKETGKTISKIDDSDLDVYQTLVFHALVQGHKITQKELILTKEDMVDFLDAVFFDFIEILPKFFAKVSPVTVSKTKN